MAENEDAIMVNCAFAANPFDDGRNIVAMLDQSHLGPVAAAFAITGFIEPGNGNASCVEQFDPLIVRTIAALHEGGMAILGTGPGDEDDDRGVCAAPDRSS